uniref:Ubiquitin-like domain-containing protein n=1 Tax=viral metagenome TaxID=1070528 RepID=A0A6C0K0R7_9ZZZZ
MSFIVRLNTDGILEYFQAQNGETVLALKERYCKKHNVPVASVKAFVDNVELNDTDTLDKAKVDMFTTIVMRIEAAKHDAISFAIAGATAPKMSVMLRPWSSTSGSPKTLGLF